MKTHHCNFRQAAVLVALVMWLSWASGCMTTNTGPQLPPPIRVELEK
jgi:hypothetical protein